MPFDVTTLALLEANDEGLRVQLEAVNDDRLSRMQEVVTEHLQRMHGGDALLIE